nr:GNAT family N-acetyltransferase [Rhodococcus sp. D2-41]
MTMTEKFDHNSAQSRFEIHVDGTLAGHADYTLSGDVRDFNHTVTDPAFRGQGIAGKVVGHALDQTRADGLKIRASCSYVEKFVGDRPEYQDLLAG